MAEVVEIGIDTSALDRDTGTLNGTLNRLQTELDGMYESVRMLDTMWDGPANEAFNQQFQADHRNMQQICETVQALVRSMEHASRSYSSGEAQVMQLVDSIRL